MKAVIIVFLLSFSLFSCNIFKWTWSEDEDSFAYSSEMYSKFIQENNFDSALYYADCMIKSDSNRYEGYYYRAKAIRYKLMGNKFSLLQELLQDSEVDTENNKKSNNIYSMPFGQMEISKMDSIYRSVIEINKNLEYIVDNSLALADRNAVLKMDLLFSKLICGVLSIQDINSNGNLLDDSQSLNLLKLTYLDGKLSVNGLDTLYEVVTNSVYINKTLENLSEIFKKSTELLTSVENPEFLPTSYLFDMAKIIPNEILKYKIGDEIDNDGDSNDFLDANGNGLPDVGESGVNAFGQVYKDGLDNDQDGFIDEGIDEEFMNGIDDDNDGLIDEDGSNISLISGVNQ